MCGRVVVLVMSEWQKGRKRVVRNVSLRSGFLCYIMSFFFTFWLIYGQKSQVETSNHILKWDLEK